MNSTESLANKPKNFFKLIITNWENLDQSQKLVLIKIWKVLTYKWQLQILFNLPFLVWWLLDGNLYPLQEGYADVACWSCRPSTLFSFLLSPNFVQLPAQYCSQCYFRSG